jgi:DNA-binding CsgD family transcriptional regulator
LQRARLSDIESLTPSEHRVAQLAAQGMSNRQIAQRLYVSMATVETHLTHVYRKLDIGSRDQLRDTLTGGA